MLPAIMETNTMAHYIDDDIITSRHLLTPKGATVRSRCNTTGLTKRKVAVPTPEKGVKEEPAVAVETATPPPPKLDLKARHEAMRARYVKIIKKRKSPRSPFGIKPGKDLQLGWQNIPLVSRFLVTGVLLTILSLTTPFWAYIRSYSVAHATFGLWHFCIGSDCWSLHDNLIAGRDIPLWYMVSQMTFTIGVVCATLAMFVVTSNHVGNQVKLSPTTNSTMVMMLVVGVLQMSTGLYTFTSYFEDVSFMYEYSEDVEEVDFYGSFWSGVVGTALILMAAMMLFFDEEIMPYPESAMYLNGYPPPGFFPPGYYPPPGEFLFPPSRDYPVSPPGSPDSYSSYPPDGYPYPPNYPPGEYPPGFPPGEFPPAYSSGEFPPSYSPGNYPDDYPPPGSYPDNALFSDMAQWDENNWTPIVSQREVPLAENPTMHFPRPKRSYVEDYLKKST